MALRMILISLVASLGLNLPSSAEFERWTKSTQTWLDARLASWDAQMPADTKAFVYYEDERQPTPVAAFADVTPPSRTTTAAAQTMPTLENVFADVPVPVVAAPEVASKEEPSVAPLVSDDVFAGVMAETVTAFTADLAPVSSPEAAPIAIAAGTAPMNTLVLGDDFAIAMESMFKAESESLIPSSEAVDECLETVAASDGFCGDFAMELTRSCDRLDVENAAVEVNANVVAATSLATPGRLTEAFRLTREAALAWANLLHAPAVVTINH